jgi:Antibiotic biosynthesis monooxygenase
MTIAVHVVNKPHSGARQAYEAAWRRIDEEGLRHPAGRQSHTAWLTGDVLHVVDVWDSPESMRAWMATLAPILDEFGMVLDGEPEVGEVLQVVRPDRSS